MLKQITIIINEIEKARKINQLDKYIIIKINEDIVDNTKDYEFLLMFNDGINCIESTQNLAILNGVMKALLNKDYVLNFDYEKY